MLELVSCFVGDWRIALCRRWDGNWAGSIYNISHCDGDGCPSCRQLGVGGGKYRIRRRLVHAIMCRMRKSLAGRTEMFNVAVGRLDQCLDGCSLVVSTNVFRHRRSQLWRRPNAVEPGWTMRELISCINVWYVYVSICGSFWSMLLDLSLALLHSAGQEQ